MNVDDAALITIYASLSNASATTLLTADGATKVRSVSICETNGGTQSVIIDVYDVANTTAYKIRGAKALTAHGTDIYDTPFVIPPAWTLRATSSDSSGYATIAVTYEAPAGRLR